MLILSRFYYKNADFDIILWARAQRRSSLGRDGRQAPPFIILEVCHMVQQRRGWASGAFREIRKCAKVLTRMHKIKDTTTGGAIGAFR